MHAQQNRANLKAWWNNFKGKKDPDYEVPYRPHDTADHPVFGKSLRESLKYASVQISTADANGNLYVWGYIPVVVAKCGLYLKENATEVPGTFRVSGSNKRMRELQAAFEAPPRYGKSVDWRKETYTTHDVASVFRRYLTQMPEPVIPHDMYHLFRDALAKRPFNQEDAIATYKSLIRKMPKPNQYLLLYVLDLLSVFARKSDLNLMTATNLAVIFRPGLISHPSHEQSPQEHNLSQRVLEFLIAQQDWFMLDISPPSPGELAEDLTYGTGGRNGVKFDHRIDMATNDTQPLVSSPEHHRNGRWPDSTNIPSPAWKATLPPGLGASSVAWNHHPDTGLSTSKPRLRTGSVPSGPSSSQPTLVPETTLSGQLTEQITPTHSVPPSPTFLHFDRTRTNPAYPQSKVDFMKAHQRRPSSPLNVSYLPNQVNRTHSGTPPPATPSGSLPSDVDELMIIPSGASLKSAEEEDSDASFVPGGGGWKIIGRNVGTGMMSAVEGWHKAGGYNGGHLGGFMALGTSKREKKDKEREREEKERRMMRRRTTFDRTGMIPHGAITPIQESSMDNDLTSINRISSGGVQRSRTLPSRRKDKLLSAEDLVGGAATDKENEKSLTIWGRKEKDKEKDKPEKRVLKKNRPSRDRASTGLSMASATGASVLTSPMVTPSPYNGSGPLVAIGQEQEPTGGRVSGS